MADTVIVNHQGQDMSIDIAQILGIDISGVTAVYGQKGLPTGLYGFRWLSWDKRMFEQEVDGIKVPRMAVDVMLEVIDVKSVADKNINPIELMGAKHRHSVAFTKNTKEDLGRLVGLLTKVGVQHAGALDSALTSATGTEFIGPINQSTDRNDKDRKYSNLDVEKCAPMGSVMAPGSFATDGGPSVPVDSIQQHNAAVPVAAVNSGLFPSSPAFSFGT